MFTAKKSLSNFIPILYSESFVLFNKVVYNGLSLELYTPFDFQLKPKSVLLPFLYFKVPSVGW